MNQKFNFLRSAMVLLIALFLTPAVMAQTTDFSGTWKLNKGKSKLNEQFSMAPQSLVMVQEAALLSVERHAEFQGEAFVTKDKFTLDGKECVNEGLQGTKKKSTAVWADDKKSLTIKTTIPMEGGGDFSLKEVYSLTEDCLVLETTATSDWGTNTETFVFNK